MPVDDNSLMDPEVSFTMLVSTDNDPTELLERVSVPFGQLGGRKLFLKKVQAHKTNTPGVAYHLHNLGHPATLIAEWTKIGKAMHTLLQAEQGRDYPYTGRTMPAFGMRANMPKINKQKTSAFEGWTCEQQSCCLAIHFERAREDAKFVQVLMERPNKRTLSVRSGAAKRSSPRRPTPTLNLRIFQSWLVGSATMLLTMPVCHMMALRLSLGLTKRFR